MGINETRDIVNACEEINYDKFSAHFVKNWIITLEFGESRSNKLKKIVNLAKKNPSFKYLVDITNNINQNSGSKDVMVSFEPNDILKFRELYDVVKNWKSVVVRIGDSVVDKKTLGRLLRCFTDKVKMKIPEFCYGVSQFTDNPFGCHRIKIHNKKYNPWYSYVVEEGGKILVDKRRILESIIVNLSDYKLCPALNPKEIFANLLRLPNEINIKDKDWVISRDERGNLKVQTKEDLKPIGEYIVNVGVGKNGLSLEEDISTKDTDKSKKYYFYSGQVVVSICVAVLGVLLMIASTMIKTNLGSNIIFWGGVALIPVGFIWLLIAKIMLLSVKD